MHKKFTQGALLWRACSYCLLLAQCYGFIYLGNDMLKLTHKAIARMAGYTVEYTYRGYYWTDKLDLNREEGYARYSCREEAYKACCIDNGLIEEASDE